MNSNRGEYILIYENISYRYDKIFVISSAISSIVSMFCLAQVQNLAYAFLISLLSFFISLLIYKLLALEFVNKFWIRVYEKGIEIKDLGFFTWDKTIFLQNKKFINIILIDGYIKDPNLEWPSFVNPTCSGTTMGENIDCEPRHLSFLLNLPNWIMSVTRKEFLDAVKSYTEISPLNVKPANPA